jgi:peptidoglycan/LPS O-acetylase OafA/YrhL
MSFGSEVCRTAEFSCMPIGSKKLSEKRVPALDGIRGIAILLVLIAHGVPFIRPAPGGVLLRLLIFGWCGVDLFFVLSGFLISGILIRTRNATNRASSFYARRVLRIFPIYYLTLIVLFVMAAYSPAMRLMVGLTGATEHAVFFGYLQNWLLLWNAMPHSIVGHFWSLAVEEQFYIIWPVIVWKLTTRSLLRLCVSASVCALLLRITLVWHFGPHFWINALTPTRGEGLLIGSALAATVSIYGKIPLRVLGIMAATGTATLGFILLSDPAEFVNTDAGPYMYTIGVTALGLFFGALVGSSQYYVPALTPLLTRNGLRSLGKYSYGLYVYHAPIYFIVTYILTSTFRTEFPLPTAQGALYVLFLTGASYVVAWLSFQLLEKRFLSLKSRFVPVADPNVHEVYAR